MAFPDDNYSKEALGGEAYDHLRTRLTASISETDTTIAVVSTAKFPNGSSGYCFVTIGATDTDAEVIRYISKDATHFKGCERGFGGKTAYSHNIGDYVRLEYNQYIHNRMCETIANLETFVRDKMRLAYVARADLEGINQYDVVCLNSAGRFTKANATYLETSFVIGIAPLAIFPNEEGYVISGAIKNENWNWNPQKLLWLSNTDGLISESKPSSGYECCCGLSIDEKTVLFSRPDYGKIAKI